MSPATERERVDLRLGSSTVRCIRHGPEDAELLLVNLHQDEKAAGTAGLRLMSACRGRLIYFEAGGTRRISFELEGRELEIDPNRIFSSPGITATLAKHNQHIPAGAAAAVAGFAAAYRELLALERARAVIALHNTRDDYSVHSYEAGGPEARNAAALCIGPDRHRHDFFLVTEAQVYEALRGLGFNVVLQHPNAVDDGSLSVLCKQLDLPYVNIEARFDAVDEQTTMLREVLDILQLPIDD